MSLITPKKAAEYLGISFGYLQHLRTTLAKEKGREGPAYYKVDARDGSANPVRIQYDTADLDDWLARRDALKDNLPHVTRIAS